MKAVDRSDVGLVRAVNEDRAYTGILTNGYTLAIVADGMGGHQAGDIASTLAVDTVVRELSSLPEHLEENERGQALKHAILRANDTVYQIASQDEKYNHMGTTIVAAFLKGKSGVIGHIGDSRAYLINRNRIQQLTEDHSLVYELMKSGQISAEEAERHPRRNVLTRALGTDNQVQVDLNALQLTEGESLLLCSDGLTNMVSVADIWSTVIDPSLPLEVRADRLIEQAIEAGGEDNVTVVLLQGSGAGTEKEGWNA
ncbi:Stp1/IreP family PP2C-type Ser/Thr phosphatase [Paenibacillus taiwanensis]|uniref:Stp1/IreP family PP2C-type Ser/Thr phosphatase n=1 Tax=Paenibacillus taiwanensis TaxID=401638 RepID=UPI0004083CBD|nr:Stp1/IreP family PP2C-type Ser/Thr phosphatase [Paenibacillus taiwanensis]